MAQVLGIGGIFFKSPDPLKLCSWYKEWLGLPFDAESGFTFVQFTLNSLPSKGYTVWSPFPTDTTYFLPSNNAFMFNLVVDDLDEALDQVKSGGAQTVGEIEDTEYGRFGWFIDPDGNKIELWQPKIE